MDLDLLRRVARKLRVPGNMTVSQRIDLSRELEQATRDEELSQIAASEKRYPAVLACVSFPRRGITCASSVVLRDMGPTAYDRYVTHIRNDEDGGYTTGHYYKNEAAGMQDYFARAGRYHKIHYGDLVNT